LALNEDKTRIVHLDDGFDFLGFTVRRQSGKLLIKPSKAAVRRLRVRLATEMKALRGANALAVISRLNPVIRGWAGYYRTVVSSKTFASLDDHMWRLLYKWSKHSHPNKPKGWVIIRYFGRFNRSRQDRWVFGDRDSGAYLIKFAWTRIVRHQLVTAGASPDDPALAVYWSERRRRGGPAPLDGATLHLLKAQHGTCPACNELLLHADHPPQSPQEWERWLRVTRTAITKQAIVRDGCDAHDVRLRLTHAHCHRRLRATGDSPAFLPASEP